MGYHIVEYFTTQDQLEGYVQLMWKTGILSLKTKKGESKLYLFLDLEQLIIKVGSKNPYIIPHKVYMQRFEEVTSMHQLQ